MPTKIGYSVVGVTSEAEGYSAKHLERQSPTVPGWQTSRFCVYPQELVICLQDTSSVKKLQLLSHQFMIPSKIEFYVGSNPSADSFKRLGYIYLSSNEKTGFKSRELKSVHVDAEGRYIRMIIHKNHMNKFNLYNQIGIMAFNVIGDPMKKPFQQIDDTSDRDKPDYISPMDDLAFDMYQDPEVASIIRKLDIQKKKAVLQENFDVAKRMKQAIADLQKVGEKLARYELDKRRAIDNEDYDLAKSKKSQMEEYRLKVYQQLQKHDLLEDAGISPSPSSDKQEPSVMQQETRATTQFLPEPIEEASQESPLPRDSPMSPHSIVVDPSKVVTPRQSVVQREASPVLASPPLQQIAYDEKIIPALSKHKQADPFTEDGATLSPVGSPEQSAVPGEPEAMSEKSVREAATVIDVFGLQLVSAAYSKTWSFREDSLLEVYKKLSGTPLDVPKEELRSSLKAAVFLVRRATKDKVHAVFHASLRLLEMLLVEFIPKHKLGKQEISHTVNRTLPSLIQKTGETAARSRVAAIDFIDRMSEFDTVHQLHLVPHHTTPPFKRDTAMRLALSRVELIERQLSKFGLEPPSLTVDNLMKFCIPALEHASGSVREASTRIIFQLYRAAGSPVKSYLPKDDNMTRKNPLYRNLFDGFDRIDGKPTQAELRAQLQAKALDDERKKKREVEELQAQISQLREMNKANAAPPQGGKQDKQTKRSPNKVQDQPRVEPDQSEEFGGNDDSFLDSMCIFCGERDDSFNEEGLDLHYWKHCPMLKRCEHCKQVVEVSGYSEHLLTECDSKNNFGKCPRCTEAIPSDQLQKHISEKKCTATKEGTQEHCPLCHHNISPGEDSWKGHLMGQKRDACLGNPRRLPSINRLRAKTEAEKATTKNKKRPQRR